ncbi:MAG: hypothetical protein IT579_16965 [Verrucomicrobia subdivision 3 bacterium]|nr:hypothetical protein [Limisphaerales bacterium]
MIRTAWITRNWLLLVLLFAGCSNQKPKELLGIWHAGPAESEWGTATIEINFKTTTDIEVKWIPTEGGEALVQSGKYRLSGSHLISEVFNKGEPVSIQLKGEDLFLELTSGSRERFHFRRK